MIVDLGPGADVSLAGGKARGLQRLLDAGLPCPPAFCVTTEALDAYLDEGGLRERLESRRPPTAQLRPNLAGEPRHPFGSPPVHLEVYWMRRHRESPVHRQVY